MADHAEGEMKEMRTIEAVGTHRTEYEFHFNCPTTLSLNLPFYDLGLVFGRDRYSRKKLRRIEAVSVTGAVGEATAIRHVRMELQRFGSKVEVGHTDLNRFDIGPINSGRFGTRLGDTDEQRSTKQCE